MQSYASYITYTIRRKNKNPMWADKVNFALINNFINIDAMSDQLYMTMIKIVIGLFIYDLLL